jgi:hypothetical protein
LDEVVAGVVAFRTSHFCKKGQSIMSTKSLLVGCAGGFIALTGAQAADLPVKAQAVQYVKICSLYGAGFYYIPGTDMCINVGGYVRTQAEWGSNNGLTAGSTNPGDYGLNTAVNGRFDRTSNNFNFTGRGVLTVDARNQSEFGTVRGYLRLGGQTLGNGETASFFVERAFIQFAGLTAGRAQSFFDTFTPTERYSYFDAKTSGDTYNYGVDLFAYTFRFGNGVSATVSAETQRHPVGVVDGAGGGFGLNGTVTTDTAGFNVPDVVGNLRIDQSWGFVGVSGALHRVAGNYYGTSSTNLQAHPEDKVGWAAEVGGLVNLPWGDSIGASFAATQGAIEYVTKAGSWQILHGGSAGVGWAVDGIFDNQLNGIINNPTAIQLTNAWSVNAGYEHIWNSRWRTSLYGGYTRVWYNQTATDIAAEHLPTPTSPPFRACGQPVEGAVWPPVALNLGEGNSCSPNFSFWQIGSRTQWDISKDLYMGVDVVYTRLNTAYKGGTPAVNTAPIYTTATSLDDQSTVSGVFRVQYNFTSGNEGPSIVFGR